MISQHDLVSGCSERPADAKAVKMKNRETLAGNQPARLPYPNSETGNHLWRYAQCRVVHGEYLVEIRCCRCGKRELL